MISQDIFSEKFHLLMGYHFGSLEFSVKYKLKDLIDIEQFQYLQDRLNAIYAFPSAIIDNDGNILTATAWQAACTQFHRKNVECEQDCLRSDRFILDHLHEAKPAVSYRCPRGLVDNATPIIIDGVHYGNFFTGQFFLEPPDLGFFRQQANRFGFDENAYLAVIQKVPIWSQDQLDHYLFFIKGLIEVIATSGLKKLHEIEARQKIEASEARADTLIQKMLDGFWIVDAQTGRVMDVNGSMCRMLGYTREELLALSVSDVDANDSPVEVVQRMQEIMRIGSTFFESRFRCKDGAIIDVDVSVTYIPGQNLFYGFHHDNTARKAAEKAMRESEIRYRTLFDQSPNGVVILDPATARPVEFNEQVCRQLGYTRDEFSQLSLSDIEVIESFEESLTHIQKIIQQGHDEFETRHRTKQGEIRDVLVIAQVVLMGESSLYHCIWRDITQRKRAEETIRKSEEKFAKAFLASPEAITIAAMKTGRYIDVNDVFLKITGFSRDEVIGHTSTELGVWVEPDDRQKFIDEFTRTGSLKGYEVPYRMRNGEIRDFQVSSEVIELDNERCTLNFILDITDRKQMDDRLKKSLAEKDTLLRELYHRTKNNMNVISSMLSLQAAYSNDPAVEAMARDTERRIQAMSLVHQMLYQSNDLSHVNLQRYINDLLSLLLQGNELQSRNLWVETDIENIDAVIDTAVPCGLILNELVSNAFKHAFNERGQGIIKVRLTRIDPQTLELVFSDNGVGVPPDFDYRGQNSLGFQTIISLVEHQLQGHASFENLNGVTWRLLFSDQLYSARV